VCATGRKLCSFLNIPAIAEPEASEYALEFVNKGKEHFDALVSCGGETFMAYPLDKSGKITNAYTGNKCASGTGEFSTTSFKSPCNFSALLISLHLRPDAPPFCGTGSIKIQDIKLVLPKNI
jgi:hypothetical protein